MESCLFNFSAVEFAFEVEGGAVAGVSDGGGRRGSVDNSSVALLGDTEHSVNVKCDEITLLKTLDVDLLAAGLVNGVVTGVVGFFAVDKVVQPPVKVVSTDIGDTNLGGGHGLRVGSGGKSGDGESFHFYFY